MNEVCWHVSLNIYIYVKEVWKPYENREGEQFKTELFAFHKSEETLNRSFIFELPSN